MNKAVCFTLVLAMSFMILLSACGTPAPSAVQTPAVTVATGTAAGATALPETSPQLPSEGQSFQESVSLVYYVRAEGYPDAPAVYTEVNKGLNDKLNTTVNFKFVGEENYRMLLSSGEAYDIIGIADWMGFWDFAAKGAFAEITDDMIKKNCPNISKRRPDELNVNILDGKRYAIPNFGTNVYNDVIIARGDLMDKYGITSVSGLDEMEAYLSAIAREETNILPYSTNSPWEMPAFFYNSMGWQAPGAPNSACPVQIDVFAGDSRVFDPIARPETREFAKRMKNWASLGFWSKSTLGAKIIATDIFKGGKSGMCVVNLDGANSLYKDLLSNGWDIRMFNAYPRYTSEISNNGTGAAISCNSKFVDRSLAVIDLLKSDLALNRLMMHGIEGVHYKLLPGNQRLPLNDRSFNWTLCGLDDADTFLFVGGGFPDAPDMLASLKANVRVNVLRDFTFNPGPVEQQAQALNDAFNQYAAPLFLGLVDDVDKAYDEYIQKRADAGLDAYMQEMQKQIDAYLADR